MDNISYTEYVNEQLNKTISYSEYVAEQIDKNISYTEYITEQLHGKDPEWKNKKRDKIIDEILNDEEQNKEMD